jgi:hypothetical protein
MAMLPCTPLFIYLLVYSPSYFYFVCGGRTLQAVDLRCIDDLSISCSSLLRFLSYRC